ncbi:MAG: tRNA (N(6)-L-threonylcarbamoyladenosine(37)-C(2))-methylthiotransferase MtaB [Deltaproteobacteria bacterium]|nr:tRNA (N(6)-L-threonylcarbamoyladenosine(37)-C(2))-methylthiotransferase MtaB [Deltaproteobacteria bacterium]
MTKNNLTISFATLGCKVNQYDSGAMADALRREGFRIVSTAAGADICIINTCVVTESTEAQSRQIIRRVLREQPGCRVIVTGCYAQKSAHELQALSDRVSVIGNTEKKDIAAFVKALQEGGASFTEVSDIAAEKIFTTPACTRLFDRTRAFLKIQDGCNSRCTYCIVPSVRGPSRSLPAGEVKNRIIELQQQGYREIVLTGIHLGAFGLDARPRTSLAELLEGLENDEALAGMRLRLSSIEPAEFTPALIDIIARSKLICPHFHIPLQSGDADVLKKMGRPYSPLLFRDLVMGLTAAIPGLNIGIDVIAGFPGETDRAFDNTAELLQELPAGYLHVFPYSRRSGTPAADFTDQVAEQVKKERALRLRRISDEKRRCFYNGHAGAIMPVLVENRRHKKTGLLRGISRNYIPVLFEGPASLAGKEVPVRIMTTDMDEPQGVLSTETTI